MLSKYELQRAQDIVYAHMQPTPAYAWPQLCAALDCEVWVKHENHTPTGAFKVRGGLVYMQNLCAGQVPAQLVTATRGNHGQSIPYAARRFNVPVQVFVPRGNSVEKNSAMRGWGAQLIEHGDDFDAAREAAAEYAQAHGALVVPSFHPDLVAGVATYAAELFHAVADLHTVYVPIGMGSGAAAVVAVRDLLGLTTEVVGVVAETADAFARSIEQGHIVETDTARTFADGVATRVPHPQAFDLLARGLSRVVRVSDAEIATALRLLYTTTHNVAEGAGAATTAALMRELAEQPALRQGRHAVILTGGNIDQAMLLQVLAGEVPQV